MAKIAANLIGALVLSISMSGLAQEVSDPLPSWAYPWINPGPEDASKFSSDLAAAMHVPDSTLTYARKDCLLYTSPSPRDRQKSRMPSSA